MAVYWFRNKPSKITQIHHVASQHPSPFLPWMRPTNAILWILCWMQPAIAKLKLGSYLVLASSDINTELNKNILLTKRD